MVDSASRVAGPPRTVSMGTDPSAPPEKDTPSILESVQDLESLLETTPGNDDCEMVVRSPVMREVIQIASRFAKSGATVLLTGESGTGKELIARWIHSQSPRQQHPYVRVNCAALSQQLLESELFGHERGAFTGAVEDRVGRFEWTAGGTLLLDEIGELSLDLQAKLLRVLEEHEYQRVGGNETYRTDARIVASTNRNLQQEVEAGNFREDLFYRLNVLQLHVPPLRERPEDVAALIAHFLSHYGHEATQPIRAITDSAMDKLVSYRWPGNTRQLRNVIHRACVLNSSGVLTVNDLPALDDYPVDDLTHWSTMALDEIERLVILAAMERYHGNKAAAARQLGVTARTLSNKINRYRKQGYLDAA